MFGDIAFGQSRAENYRSFALINPLTGVCNELLRASAHNHSVDGLEEGIKPVIFNIRFSLERIKTADPLAGVVLKPVETAVATGDESIEARRYVNRDFHRLLMTICAISENFTVHHWR